MAILTLKPGQKSVCAIPPTGVDGKPEWNSESDLFNIDDIAEDGMTATVVAASESGGVGFVVVTAGRTGKGEAGDDDSDVASEAAFIATLEVRVEGDGVRFAEVSASTPDQK